VTTAVFIPSSKLPWHPYTVEFKTAEGEFSTHIYARDEKHAAETVDCLKKTATVGRRIVEVLPNAEITGPGSNTALGCPECLREENKRLRAFLTTIAYTGLTGADAAEHAAEALNAE